MSHSSRWLHRGVWAGLLAWCGAGAEAGVAADTAPEPTPTEAAAPADVAEVPGAGSYWRALAKFRVPTADSLAQGRTLLDEAAGRGFAPAQSLLGSCLLNETYGYVKETGQGFGWLQRAAQQGDNFARVAVAECYFSGNGVSKDLAQAETLLHAVVAPEAVLELPTPPDWFAKPAEAANRGGSGVAGALEYDPATSARAYARHLLGLIAQARARHAEAQEHFLAAAQAGRAGRAGVPDAAVQAALNWAYGRGVARDRAQAITLLEHAGELQRRRGAQQVHGLALQGAIEAFAVADLEESIAENTQREMAATQFAIAEQLADPTFAQHDLKEAALWYELAAGHNHAGAMVALGLIHSRGRLGAPDRAQAFAWFAQAGGGDSPLDVHAAACLAICHLRGLGTPADANKAQAIFARWRDDDFLCHLGVIGQAPADVLSAEEAGAKLAEWVKKKRKDVHAEFLLAKDHLVGRGRPANVDEGIRRLKAAADHGSGAACGVLGDYYQFTKDDRLQAAKYYERGLRRKDARSAVDLARQQLGLSEANRGRRGSADALSLAAAAKLCDKALSFDADFVAAHELFIMIGTTYTTTVWVDSGRVEHTAFDLPRARDHAMRADKLGSGLAAFHLGLWAYDGTDEPKDFRRAYNFFSIAADRGLSEAHVSLGIMHESGQGVPVTPEEAAYHYRIAAVAGNEDAVRRLAMLYLGDGGLPEDLERAAFWYSVLARAGDQASMLDLAKVMLRQKRFMDALELLGKIAASRDDWIAARANAELARCYRLGLGVAVNADEAKVRRLAARRNGVMELTLNNARHAIKAGDVAKAIPLYEAVAEVLPEASYALGQMYFFGQNVTANRTVAVEYLRRAAADEHREALYFIAGMTLNREDGAPSLDEAIEFARRAVALGSEPAVELLEKLEKRKRRETP